MERSKRNKYSLIKIIILLACIAIIVMVLTWFAYDYYKYFYKTKEIKVYEMKIKVEPGVVGFNVGKEELNFGTTIPTGGSSRNVVVSSEEPVRVLVFFEGQMKNWVNVNKNNFILEGNETLTFAAFVPANAAYGNYTGKAIIVFKKL
ncbi:MAG: hypothetical protein N3G19_00515 [Candidatus Pacearchaeota archaeon]|nr:hypothetical protein [Candidatus Pacearchaeota archaeon]